MQADQSIPTINTPRTEFLSGVKAELPLMIGVIPFGMIYGILAIAAGLPAVVAQSMSFIIFAGSSQFVSAQLFGLGVPGIINIFTVWVINLRHALYGASVAPYLEKLPTRWKLALAYLLTDEPGLFSPVCIACQTLVLSGCWFDALDDMAVEHRAGHIPWCFHSFQLVAGLHPCIDFHCPGHTITQR